jgi:ribosomal protein S18 acetylase RimI-like enzyme
MTEADFAAWRDRLVPDFAQESVKSGRWSAEDALAKSRVDFDERLPQGRATPGHHLFHVVDGSGSKVGVLWINEQDRGGERIAYVYNIEIDPEHRRCGHARAAFQLLEAKAKAWGLSGIALRVFGHNHEARALYEKLGFEPTRIQMFKRLP